MLKILHTESSLGWGGQEIRVIQESLGMISRGHKLIIAAPANSIIYQIAKVNGLTAFPIPIKKHHPVALFQLSGLIKNQQIDIVNTHSSTDSWAGTLAAKLSGQRPRLIRTRHLSTPISRSFSSRLIYDICPDAIITTGDAIKERMIRVNGFQPDKIHSIPTGVDLDRFDPGRRKPAMPRNDSFRIGALGVLRDWKGHSYLLQAVPQIVHLIPEAHFYIVGGGPQYHNLKKQIELMKLGRYVSLLGHREDVPEILASFDLLVHPSTGSEGVPQSLLQALAMEKAVIASDVGAINEVIINGQTGFLINPASPEQIAAKVMELYRFPEIGVATGRQGRKFVQENYGMGIMLDKLEGLYAELLR
jgi:glycosyltransferase involved in cell wall biosynthesis